MSKIRDEFPIVPKDYAREFPVSTRTARRMFSARVEARDPNFIREGPRLLFARQSWFESEIAKKRRQN